MYSQDMLIRFSPLKSAFPGLAIWLRGEDGKVFLPADPDATLAKNYAALAAAGSKQVAGN